MVPQHTVESFDAGNNGRKSDMHGVNQSMLECEMQVLATAANTSSFTPSESKKSGDSHSWEEKNYFDEVSITPTNHHDARRRSSAAISIQRRVRGIGARASVSRRRESLMSESAFMQTLNPLLSPAENAANALLDLATVRRHILQGFILIVLIGLKIQRLNLSVHDIAIINYAVRTLQVEM